MVCKRYDPFLWNKKTKTVITTLEIVFYLHLFGGNQLEPF